MFKKIISFISSAFLLFSYTFVSSVFAKKERMDEITPGITSIPQFIKSLLDIVIKLGVTVSAFFLIWAGYLFVTSQGDPGKLTTARRAFTWAVIGTAVVLGSWLIASVIQVTIWQNIGGNPAP